MAQLGSHTRPGACLRCHLAQSQSGDQTCSLLNATSGVIVFLGREGKTECLERAHADAEESDPQPFLAVRLRRPRHPVNNSCHRVTFRGKASIELQGLGLACVMGRAPVRACVRVCARDESAQRQIRRFSPTAIMIGCGAQANWDKSTTEIS